MPGVCMITESCVRARHTYNHKAPPCLDSVDTGNNKQKLEQYERN